MAFGAISVGNTATKIVGSNSRRIALIIENNGAETIYIGKDDTVTSSTGVAVLSNGTFTQDSGGMRMYLGDFWGITASSTSDVRYWEMNNDNS